VSFQPMVKVTIINDAGSGDPAAPTVTPITPAVRRLVVSTPVDEGILGRAPQTFVGVVEQAWFDDEASAAAAYGAASLADLTAPGALRRFVARENVVMPRAEAPSPQGVKLIAFFRRRDDLGWEAFQRYWAERHAPLVKRTPLLRSYVQTHLLKDHYLDGRSPAFDGTAELWWDSVENYRQSWASPEMQEEQGADVLNFLSRAGSYVAITREQIRSPAAAALYNSR
jgi:uncharacterized protein (TIGR02118 family)